VTQFTTAPAIDALTDFGQWQKLHVESCESYTNVGLAMNGCDGDTNTAWQTDGIEPIHEATLDLNFQRVDNKIFTLNTVGIFKTNDPTAIDSYEFYAKINGTGGGVCASPKPMYGARFPTEIYTRGCHWIPRMFA
jgi:hypothetical protein